MKTVITMLFLVVMTGMTASAQSITFDESGVLTGALGKYSSPSFAGQALKNVYSNVFDDWGFNNGHPIAVEDLSTFLNQKYINSPYNYHNSPHNLHGSGKVLHIPQPSNACYIRIGPLHAGTFIFGMLYSDEHPSNPNANYATCRVLVYNSLNQQVGSTQSFQVGAPNHATLPLTDVFFVSESVPAGGYVRLEGSTGAFFIDNISAAGGPVPVELVSFSARFVRNGVELNWHTATELNNYGFAIERSRDGRIWDEIDFVAGAGNSYSPKSYTYTDQLDDATRRAPRLAYRLRQIDRDGTTDYSNIVFVRTGALPTGVELHGTYPNPFNPEATISFTLAEAQTASLRVFDVHGREMALLLDNAEMQDGTHTVNFSGERLPSGVYIVVLQAGDVVRHQRIVLSK
jgi:hypothetical protein